MDNGQSAAEGNRSPRRRWAAWLTVGLLLATSAGAVWYWWPTREPRPVAGVEEDAEVEADPPAINNPGYLGPQACAACHARRVAEFLKTRHAIACCPPRPAAMPAGFSPGRGMLATRLPSLRFEMTRAGNAFQQTVIRATPAGEQRTAARVALVYGSAGAADEMYFAWHGDRLYELPAVWFYPLDRWGHASLPPHGTGDLGRETQPRCLECHNTWFSHLPGTANQYRPDQFVLGVTCERCHGPGRDHVAFHQAHPRADTAHAIVHPGQLDRERLLEVCTQCHSNAITPRGPALAYRPGKPLADYYRTITTEHPEDDHVANQIQYLRRSKCFQKSDLTCVTCHDPHRPSDPAAVRGACLKCHKPADCGEQPRLPGAVRDDCAACHMPARVWMNVHFHTEDDQFVPPVRRFQHRIAVHPEAHQEVLLAWYRTRTDPRSQQEAARLGQALGQHWLAEAEKRQRAHRFLAAIGAVREALHVNPGPAPRARLRELVAIQAGLNADLAEALHQAEQRRLPEAIAGFNKVLSVKPNYAMPHAKLGTLYAATGQRELAVKHLEAVARCNPNDPSGYAMLGWLAYLDGRAEEAAASYRRALELEPWSAKNTYHQGLAQLRLGRWAEAARSFRRVTTIDPNHAGGYQGLAHALRKLGQAGEALPFARRAARLTRFQDADVLMTLAGVYTDAGRLAEAEETLARALTAAQASNPQLVPQIHAGLEDLRARARSGRDDSR
jgi:tetratricopeptide (TPR) repeat protein